MIPMSTTQTIQPYSLAEAARSLGVTPAMTSRWADDKRLVEIRVNARGRFVTPESVEQVRRERAALAAEKAAKAEAKAALAAEKQ